MAKKSSLGKGLDLIFDDNTIEGGSTIAYIELEAINPKKNQPRKYFDDNALNELASSIALHGVLQPILVRDMKNGTYEIIAGERRWRASKQAGLSEIPCIIMEADEIQAAQMALIENIQREDLNAYEEAKAYKALIDDFGLTHEEVSNRVGKSRPEITNTLKLLELPEKVVEMLVNNDISAGHCKNLVRLHDKSKIEPLAERIVSKKLSVREVEAAVKRLNSESEVEVTKKPGVNKDVVVDYYEELERKATALCGRKIRICAAKNRQTVQIEYTDMTDLEEILEAVCGQSVIEKE